MAKSGYPALSLFIGGVWIGPEGRDCLAVLNPADETEIGRLPVAGEADLDRALKSAAAGFAVWSKVCAFDRAKLLHRAAALMRERANENGRISTMEQGKLLAEATACAAVPASPIAAISGSPPCWPMFPTARRSRMRNHSDPLP